MKTLSDVTILRSVMNSLIVSVTAASAAVLITYITAWLVVRSNLKMPWALDQIAMISCVFPGIVMGVAILKMYLSVPFPIYRTLWILVIAFITRFLPYGLRFVTRGFSAFTASWKKAQPRAAPLGDKRPAVSSSR